METIDGVAPVLDVVHVDDDELEIQINVTRGEIVERRTVAPREAFEVGVVGRRPSGVGGTVTREQILHNNWADAIANLDGNATRADYTFAYHKLEGRVLISLHHSSLTWFPPLEA